MHGLAAIGRCCSPLLEDVVDAVVVCICSPVVRENQALALLDSNTRRGAGSRTHASIHACSQVRERGPTRRDVPQQSVHTHIFASPNTVSIVHLCASFDNIYIIRPFLTRGTNIAHLILILRLLSSPHFIHSPSRSPFIHSLSRFRRLASTSQPYTHAQPPTLLPPHLSSFSDQPPPARLQAPARPSRRILVGGLYRARTQPQASKLGTGTVNLALLSLYRTHILTHSSTTSFNPTQHHTP